MVVGGDECLVAMIQNILRNEGCESDSTASGEAALEKAMNADYQMAILDIKLPDTSGIEVARKIRKQQGDIHFIIISGYPELADSIEAINVGIDEILLKPIRPDELLRAVKDSIV